jgi:uncharacterized LabA/DUF88 family protein
MSCTNKIALFIDGANLYVTAKTLGFDIDYKRLLEEFQSRGTLLRALYYTAIAEDQEYSAIRPLIDWLGYNGFTVVTKATKEFIDANGRQRQHGHRACGRCHGVRRAHRRDGFVLGRWRFPLARGSDATPWGPRHRDFEHCYPTAIDCRRAAAPSRRLH